MQTPVLLQNRKLNTHLTKNIHIFLLQSNYKAMKMIKSSHPYISQMLGSDRRKLKLDDQTEMIRGKRFVRKSSQRPQISLRQQRQATQQLQTARAPYGHNTAGHYSTFRLNIYFLNIIFDPSGFYGGIWRKKTDQFQSEEKYADWCQC